MLSVTWFMPCFSVSWAPAASSHGEQDQSDQHGGSLPFRSGDVLGIGALARSQVLDLGFDDDFDVLLHAGHLDHLEQVPLGLHVEQAGRSSATTARS